MQFRNRKNECVQLSDGREEWISRSVAVAVSVLLQVGGQPYVLINQRGPGLPDGVGLWNMPCGYLDFDETTGEAALREVWEECGVNLLPLRDAAHVDYLERAWDVSSTPRPGRQNVTVHHGLVASATELPAVSAEHNEPGETSDIVWSPLSELGRYDFAFGHRERITYFVDWLYQERRIDLRSGLARA